MVWETESLKTCHLIEPQNSQTWYILFQHPAESAHRSILGSVTAGTVQCILQSLVAKDTHTVQIPAVIYSKSHFVIHYTPIKKQTTNKKVTYPGALKK